MDVRPIRTDTDHEAALAEIDRLMDARPGTPEGDRLDVLVSLVQAYEARRFAHPALDPVDTILGHMENRGLTRRDLEAALGSRARVAEILGRRRRLTLPMIRRLHEWLGIPAEALIRPYELESA